ncbi:MAG TPA: hypothetical protein VD794_02185 [Flavisolibacter sp.]|nr:hypothetical protein [Flavisolibacter sp.]
METNKTEGGRISEILKECTGHAHGLTDAMHFQAMKLYATEKVKEALSLAASKSQEMIYERGECNMRVEGDLVLRNFQVCYATPKQDILSLESVLVEQINQEKP